MSSTPPPPLPLETLQYATPVTRLPQANGMWRDGNTLVVGRTAILPRVCIRCGGPEAAAYNRTAYWHPPLLYLMILFPGLLIYALVAMIVRKKATYTCSLCATHKAQRRKNLLIAWSGVLIALAAFALAVAGGNDAFGRPNEGWVVATGVIAGLASLLFAAIYGLVTSPLLKPKRIDEHYAYYTGAGSEFLAPLSQVT